jgi:hypothetical protein
MEMKVTVVLLILAMLTLSASQLFLSISLKKLEKKVEYMGKAIRAMNSERRLPLNKQISFKI